MESPTAANLIALAGTLDLYTTLVVEADGAAYLVRSHKVRTPAELEQACAGYQPGDAMSIRRHAEGWHLELRRKMHA